MPSGKPNLYWWLPIRKNSIRLPPPCTQGEAEVLFYFKDLSQRGLKLWGGDSGLMPSNISPQKPDTLSCCPNQQYGRDRPIVWRRRCPRIPSAHQDCLPQNHHTNGHWEKNLVSNCTWPTEGQSVDQELDSNNNSDVALVENSGANDNNSEYVESWKTSPTISDNSTKLKTLIEKIVEMHNDTNTAIKEFYTPRALFTHPHELDPIDRASVDTIPTKTLQDNGVTLPLLTQPSPPNLPLVDARKPCPPLCHVPTRTRALLPT